MDHDETERAEESLPGRGESIWLGTTPRTSYAPLSDGLTVDTVVIGGGIVGLTTAIELKEAGRDVAVVEAGRILEGVTGHTTAKLTSKHGLIYDHLVAEFGEDRARRYADANQTAIDEVESRADEWGVDCDFTRVPAYTYTRDADERGKIRREVNAARSLGLPVSYVEDGLPFDIEAAIRFDDQARFHPRKYLLAMAERIPGDGSYLFERTRAVDVSPGRQCRVETERGTVTAEEVVLATHFPILDRGAYFARMSPKRSYVLAVRLAEEIPDELYYRAGDPYFSVRRQPTDEGTLTLVGGQNHRTGEGGSTRERYRKVERAARAHFDVESVEYRWSTQDFVSPDRVPFVGPVGPLARNVYVATGFGGWGMTNGTVAGMLLSDLVLGRSNPWAEVYEPMRFTPGASAKELLSHNVDAAKHFVGDRAKKSLGGDAESLSPGEAAVVREGGKPVAAYRDEEGELHAVSAVCTHMKCLVEWNDAEESWDCPCHGSRFDPDGEVLDTPAVRGLPEVDEGKRL